MALQEEEDTTITLSIGGVEFCLTPSSTDTESDDDDDAAASNNSLFISKIRNNEVLINLTNFSGTLRVENYNITAAGSGPSSANKPKKKRAAPKKHKVTNHAADDRMKNAVEEWDRLKGEEGAPSKKAFAKERGLNPRTFCKYVCDDPAKRHKIGVAPGKKPLVPEHIADMLAVHVSHIDEDADDLMTTPRTVVNSLMQLHPEITYPQAINYVQRTWKKKHGERLHKGTLKKAEQAFIRPHLPDLPPPDHLNVNVPNVPPPDPGLHLPDHHHDHDSAYNNPGGGGGW